MQLNCPPAAEVAGELLKGGAILAFAVTTEGKSKKESLTRASWKCIQWLKANGLFVRDEDVPAYRPTSAATSSDEAKSKEVKTNEELV